MLGYTALLVLGSLCQLINASKMQAIFIDRAAFPITQPGVVLTNITDLFSAKSRCAEIAARMGVSTFQLEYFRVSNPTQIANGSMCHVGEVDKQYTMSDISPAQSAIAACYQGCTELKNYKVSHDAKLKATPKRGTKPLFKYANLPTANDCIEFGARNLQKSHFNLYDPSPVIFEWKSNKWQSTCTGWRDSDFSVPVQQIVTVQSHFALGLLAPIEAVDRYVRNMACTNRHVGQILQALGCTEVQFNAEGVVQRYKDLKAEFGLPEPVLDQLPLSALKQQSTKLSKEKGRFLFHEQSWVTDGATPVTKYFKSYQAKHAVANCDKMAKDAAAQAAFLAYRLNGYSCTVFPGKLLGVAKMEEDASIIYGWIWTK